MKTRKIYFKLYLLKTVLVLILAICLFNSCKKIEEGIPDTIVHGLVRNSLTNKPIVNATIKLIRWEDDGNGGMVNVFIIDTLSSDINGRFEYRFKPRKIKTQHYYLDISKPQSCYIGGRVTYGILYGKENNIDVRLSSNAHLKYHLKNTSPFDANDQICLPHWNEVGFSAGICQTGMAVDYLVDLQTNYGEVIIPVKWEVTKNSTTIYYTDSISVAPCDTTVYNIFY